MISIAYKQGRVIKRFKETRTFSCMSKELGMTNSTMCFKINLYKLTKKNPRLKNSTLLLYYFKNNFKLIKIICARSNEFKSTEPQPM